MRLKDIGDVGFSRDAWDQSRNRRQTCIGKFRFRLRLIDPYKFKYEVLYDCVTNYDVAKLNKLTNKTYQIGKTGWDKSFAFSFKFPQSCGTKSA